MAIFNAKKMEAIPESSSQLPQEISRSIDLSPVKPIIAQIPTPQEELSTNRALSSPVYLAVAALLKKIEGNEEDFQKEYGTFEKLLAEGADANQVFRNQTPLDQLFFSLGGLYMKRMPTQVRQTVYQRVYDITERLLIAKADPNKPSARSTPLTTLLAQDAPSSQEVNLKNKLVNLSKQYGADLSLKPAADRYNIGSPESLIS